MSARIGQKRADLSLSSPVLRTAAADAPGLLSAPSAHL
ncbi:hypothetical protein HMPREF9413_2563 [Paenibacillus sp. HGF7]|nr:hypothetical protein HMPREF9413_2563 [Paenibacillus sp. HGF7]